MTNRAGLRRLRITLRVSEQEHAALSTAADRAGLCLSSFVRCSVLGLCPATSAQRPRRDTVMLAALLAQLGAIATALHQIATRLAQPDLTGSILPGLERELNRALAELRIARNDMLRALGRGMTA